MKKNKILKFKLSALALALSSSLSFNAKAETYDFKQCVESALNQNPEMDVSSARIHQAQSALGKAEASRLPQITLSMTGSNSDNALNVFGMKLQQRSVDTQTDFQPSTLNNPNAHTDFNTRIEVLLPVWNGGKISSYEDQAAAMIQAARQGDVAVQQYLTFNVYQAYEAVHAARSYINVAEQAKLTADEFVRTTKNLVEQGIVVRSEFLSAKVNQSSTEVALLKAQGQEQIALDTLKMLMNVDVNQEVDVAERTDLELPATSVESLLSMAMATNPQLEAKRKEAYSTKFAIEAAKADYYPSFNVMLRQEWNDEAPALNHSSYTVAGVVSWKITDFGVTSNSVDMAKSAALEKKSALHSEENKTRLEVLTAWRKMEVAIKQVDFNILAVEQASEAQKLVLKRYEGGVATMTEVLAAQTQLDKARAELVAAKYDVNVFKAKIRLVTGTMNINHL
ncbi:TolC family protein [Thiomicrorhabdus arctica]|jgi:outer membrane protein TolC|uniref:TolC family protein n=1 Tax=Thiomicrorhabdus arctica TaxID=131540 RepID=UPI000373DB0D|nr:TolC family protein [Thiomicrorhabdus arctica]